MNEQSRINKQAWEYRAYEFWCNRDGTPSEKSIEILKDPKKSLKKHREYFDDVNGLNIANICGSNGRRAVPLAILGADVTIFDLSEENKRYALELADCSNTTIEYIVGDILDIDVEKYRQRFDFLYLEGGVLHYFNDLIQLMNILFPILKVGGKLIMSDYHPIKRCISPEFSYIPIYFNHDFVQGDISYKQFFDVEEQHDFPSVSLSHHTLSDIINSVVSVGFTLQRFDEHRGWNGENIPWEFTLLAEKVNQS
ncbi:bifunctional 2-polyprenyl-6-hydroxyphenol methylase/3-demethylubiquinol 3-O-methyltransferase UbiG [Exiguobacterium sp. SRB7LM]|uniref:class I SAM-dependent methyltransferase n=1 Tax=Exiguobacterium sp. SRB7LM TaxID=2608401 RepID=UPI0018C3CB2E|nr:class I SAM-dependent methyltransferase [Exiguobacterium sp. SRB7LM]MBG0916943.1 methyltransferase domain-containing protein [Exiguobacterium sp. SRB7LM]